MHPDFNGIEGGIFSQPGDKDLLPESRRGKCHFLLC
jgi:hypothetical protein